MNRAFDGDKVLVELDDASKWEELPAKDKKDQSNKQEKLDSKKSEGKKDES